MNTCFSTHESFSFAQFAQLALKYLLHGAKIIKSAFKTYDLWLSCEFDRLKIAV